MTDERLPIPADDPLVQVWHSTDDDMTTLAATPDDLATTVADAHRTDQRRLLWLNIQEVAPAIGLGVLFAIWSIGAPVPWAVLAAALVSLAVGAYLAINSLRHHRSDQRFGGSVREQLARRLDQVTHRATLYRTVIWWYLLPLTGAIVLLRYGTTGELRFQGADLAYWAVVAVMFVVLSVVNRRIGRTKYETEAERLTNILAEFDRAA